MTPITPTQQTREEEIERLALEIAQLIREAEPETREQLAESVAAMIRQEARPTPTAAAASPSQRRPMNPLAAGIGLVLVGGGLTFITPPVGLFLLVCGLVAVIWGLVMSWVRS